MLGLVLEGTCFPIDVFMPQQVTRSTWKARVNTLHLSLELAYIYIVITQGATNM
jgi:hypothetical protein